ncbi:sugar-binding transcriptional regulator [Melghirimyces algeriensis]|uniref:Central glycolytic genes regulator n=1 Tax=Melghirimyces algeriensis TaxID=910412 RepID=A0A521D0H0_9BACL|nr:sugar-binding domain-containing protein [Melghirimyces algeriensis]SMO65168.1 central glycolytic genes regulator [Melghirimyces algeriensis]
MKTILELQRQLLPDLLDVMRKRYEVLRHLQLMQPIGRRSLASALGMTERVLRSEVEFLKERGLVRIDTVGMQLTHPGGDLVSKMEPLIKDLFGLTDLEADLCRVLNLEKAVVVPGDSDRSDLVKKEMGRAGARLLKQIVHPGQVVAVAGGTTVAAVAEMMTSSAVLKESTFVPARGGLGEAVELEANYIASLMAQKAGGKYRLMHVPEQLSKEAYQMLLREPHIQEVLDLVHSARIVVHGIGDAIAMASRRKASPALLRELKEKGAVGEAFGYYFNQEGEIIHRGRSIGLSLEDLKHVDATIAIAGGAGKAKAVAAVCPVSGRDTLITDEAAARAILDNDGC